MSFAASCSNCGAALDEHYRQCPDCGHVVDTSPVPPTPAPEESEESGTVVHRRGGVGRAHMLPIGVVGIGLAAMAAVTATLALLGPSPAEFPVRIQEGSIGAVQLRASNSDDYDVEQLTVAAGEPIVIDFFNEDVHPHNVAIDAPGGVIVGEPLAEAGTMVRYEFEAGTVAVGRHRFFCTLHPWMEGLLLVE